MESISLEKIGIQEIIPKNFKYFTTWAWYLILIISALHLLKISPSIVAGGMFPISLMVLIIGSGMMVMCSQTNVCPARLYKKFSSERHLQHFGKIDANNMLSAENLGTHVFPLLLLCCVLLIRPSKSTMIQRLSISVIPFSIYMVHAYFVGPNVDEVYNLDAKLFSAAYLIIILLSFIPV